MCLWDLRWGQVLWKWTILTIMYKELEIQFPWHYDSQDQEPHHIGNKYWDDCCQVYHKPSIGQLLAHCLVSHDCRACCRRKSLLLARSPQTVPAANPLLPDGARINAWRLISKRFCVDWGGAKLLDSCSSLGISRVLLLDVKILNLRNAPGRGWSEICSTCCCMDRHASASSMIQLIVQYGVFTSTLPYGEKCKIGSVKGLLTFLILY